MISFSDDEDDDSESDIETKGNASRLDSNLKRPSSSFEKSNKLQLQQNTRSLHKEMPKRSSLNRTFISSMTKNPGYNSKGAGSMSLGQGSRARNFNPMSKKFASQERGHDQGAVSNVNKLQDLRHRIALRESELKLKAAQQNKESASVLGKEQKAMNLKNDTARKITPVSSGAPHLEPKEPDRKRLKLGTSNGTPQAVGNQQEAPAVKSILLSKDSIRENYYPQDINKVDHSQKEIPLCGGEAAVNTSQSQPDKHLNNSLQNLPCRSRDGKYIALSHLHLKHFCLQVYLETLFYYSGHLKKSYLYSQSNSYISKIQEIPCNLVSPHFNDSLAFIMRDLISLFSDHMFMQGCFQVSLQISYHVFFVKI